MNNEYEKVTEYIETKLKKMKSEESDCVFT